MKRFDIISEPGEPPREDENGDWVKYEDCMEAERELVELREEKTHPRKFYKEDEGEDGLRYQIQQLRKIVTNKDWELKRVLQAYELQMRKDQLAEIERQNFQTELDWYRREFGRAPKVTWLQAIKRILFRREK